MKKDPTKLKVISAVLILILPFASVRAAPSSSAKLDKENIEMLFDILREHTSYGLSNLEYEQALSFNPGKNLKALRDPFEKNFQVKDPKRDHFSAIGATFTYLTGIPDPDAPYGSGKTLPHAFTFGRPPKVEDSDVSILDRPYDKRIFQKSSYFLSDQNSHVTDQYLLAPLRMDQDLVVMAASMGSQFDKTRWAQKPKDGPMPYFRTPRRLVLLIGVRTDEIDKLPELTKLNRQNEMNLSTEELMKYSLRIGTMTNDELELARQEQLKKMPDVTEFDRFNNTFRTLEINHERAAFNLGSRDMREEVRDLVERAAAKVPGFSQRAMRMFEDGGFGVMQTRNGTQYLVQSLMIPVLYPYHPTFIDKEIPDFVRALIDPEMKVQKKILLPKDIKKGLALLKKMTEERSAADAKKALDKASQINSAEAQTVMADLFSRLKSAGKESPDGASNRYYDDNSKPTGPQQCRSFFPR